MDMCISLARQIVAGQRDIGRMQPRRHAVNAGRKGSCLCLLPECQSIACRGFLYVLMRKSQATAGLAIYDTRAIGEVSKLFSSVTGVWGSRVQA